MTTIETLIENFGYSEESVKWVIPEGEITEYLGIEMVAIEFTRPADKMQWTSKVHRAVITDLSFKPMTMTYSCSYRLLDSDKPTEHREVDIIPSGFSLIDSDSTWMIRFIPFSIHSKRSEVSGFFDRLKNLYPKTTSISITSLKNLDKEKSDSAIYLRSGEIGLLVQLKESKEILWIRAKTIIFQHEFKDKYKICIKSMSGQVFNEEIRESDNGEYDFVYSGEVIGRFKIIDLGQL